MQRNVGYSFALFIPQSGIYINKVTKYTQFNVTRSHIERSLRYYLHPVGIGLLVRLTIVISTARSSSLSLQIVPQSGIIECALGHKNMNTETFARARHYLGKTQVQLSGLLGVSPKAVQSFEQGWRNIPVSAERQLMFLLYLSKVSSVPGVGNCWEVKQCPNTWKEKCIAWEFGAGNLCWFVNGTFCNGQAQKDWEVKIKTCQQCDVLRSVMPSFLRSTDAPTFKNE